MMKPSLSPLLLAALLAPALRAQTPAPATAMATPAVVPTNPALQSQPAHSTANPAQKAEALPAGQLGPMVQNNEALRSGQAVSNEALQFNDRAGASVAPAAVTNEALPAGQAVPTVQNNEALQFNGRAGASIALAAESNEALPTNQPRPVVATPARNGEALPSGQAVPAVIPAGVQPGEALRSSQAVATANPARNSEALQSHSAHSMATPARNGEALPAGQTVPAVSPAGVHPNEALPSGQAISNEALRSSQSTTVATGGALRAGQAASNEALPAGQAAPAAPAIPTSAELPFGTLADRIRAAQHRQAETAAHNRAVLAGGAVPMLNQASDRLLERLAAAKSENPVVSGPGVALLLQQVADGARGPSQTEIQRWLAVKNQPSARLEGLLAQQDSALQQAGALLIPRAEAVLPDYRAGLERAGFVLAADVAELNQRVAALSHQQIPRLLERLDPGVSLVLVHGLHFAAPWAEPFDPARTQPRPFRPLQGSKITVPMMEKTLNLRRLDDRHARLQAVALPFAGDYVLLLARPDQPSTASLRDAGRWLSQHQAELLNAEPRPLKLGLPRWQLRRENPLVATLQAEGIRTVFGIKADLGGIGPDLRVGDVRQTLSLSIDEQGGRADVATVTEIVPRSASLAPPPELWLDRPFVYALVAQSNGLTLLKGQLHRPVGVQP